MVQPFNHTSRKNSGDYKFIKSQEKINDQMYQDNINCLLPHQKNEEELEILKKKKTIYDQYIGM